MLVLAAVLWSLINFILGFIFLVLGVAAAAVAISQFSVRRIAMPPRIFMLQGRPALVIRNPTGVIRIHSGVTNTVEVMATKYVNGWFGSQEEGAIDYAQDGDTIRITTRSNYRWSPLGGLRNVNLDITVPEHCDIQVDGSAGSIRIEGIRGQVKVGTSAGTIHVQQVTLEGQSRLTTSAGTIDAQQATLKGQVNLNTNTGTISFAGELDPQGYYRFGTNLGTIDVVLPGDSSFTLAVATDLGSVNNQFGSTTVGSAPHARLELRTKSGFGEHTQEMRGIRGTRPLAPARGATTFWTVLNVKCSGTPRGCQGLSMGLLPQSHFKVPALIVPLMNFKEIFIALQQRREVLLAISFRLK